MEPAAHPIGESATFKNLVIFASSRRCATFHSRFQDDRLGRRFPEQLPRGVAATGAESRSGVMLTDAVGATHIGGGEIQPRAKWARGMYAFDEDMENHKRDRRVIGDRDEIIGISEALRISFGWGKPWPGRFECVDET